MLKKRIIPCLDIKDGRTVKGTNFIHIKDAGDPIALSRSYVLQGADELVFLDITATIEKRKALLALVERIAKEINIPFTVGGGINTIQDVSALISAGADKVSINSAAVNSPELLREIADEFGSQCLVLAIDTHYINDQWTVYTHGGRIKTPLETITWAKKAAQYGAGEILLTSMNNDGTKNGFATTITHQVSNAVNIPVIASGGAGKKEHFKIVFTETTASAALAAGIFHFGTLTIPELKTYLKDQNIPIR